MPADDGDVGLYLHIANGWLHGSLPYVAAWEYKPPGLFAILALALAAFGSFNVAMAVVSAVAVFSTAVLLMLITQRLASAQEGPAPLIAALFFIFLSTENGGLAGDAELLIAPFIAAAILALAPFETGALPRVRYLWSGLAAGMALQMMLLAAPIVVVLAALAAWRARSISRLAIFIGAALAPFALEAVVYARAGAFDYFYDANAGATLRRMQSHRVPALGGVAGAVAEQLRILAPAIELAPFAALSEANFGRVLVVGWLMAALATIAGAAEFYDRHFLLLVPPLCILGALGTVNLGRRLARPKTVAVVAVLTAFAMHDYYMTRVSIATYVERRFYHADPVIGDHYLTARFTLLRAMGTDRSLYLVNESPLLYDELKTVPPTRYPFAQDLIERGMSPMLGFEGIDELRRILDTKPHFVLAGAPNDRDDPVPVAFLQARLNRDYIAIDRVNGSVLYRLRSYPG